MNEYPVTISVVMPVYNGEENLSEAIESILNQTYRDFEFIIVCEYGSNDESMQIVRHYESLDPRIVTIYNDSRLGIAASLNRGLRAARGEYIARMDGDDISSPRRFEIQKLYMDNFPDIGILGIRHKVIGAPNWLVDYPADPDTIACEMLFMSPLRHPTIMMRRSDIEKYGLYYDDDLMGVEDYELYIRASKYIRISNILEDDLFYHRRSSSNLSLVYRDRDDLIQKSILKDMYRERLSMELTDEEVERVAAVSFLNGCEAKDVVNELKLLDELLQKIVEQNRSLAVSQNDGIGSMPYPEDHLLKAILHRWMRARYKFEMRFRKKVPDGALQAWRNGTYYRRWMN